MENNFKQTWWDQNLNTHMDVFERWIGDYNSESKIKIRQHVISKNYKSLVDFGCGVATEYYGYKNDNYDIKYLGVDSSTILNERNGSQGIPMILSDVDNVPLEDSSYDVSFSRHVWEHQPSYKPCLDEMIRISSKETIHVFFIKPDVEKIDYNPSQNLYHNTFNKNEIEKYCYENKKVKNVYWVDINNQECSIHVELN
jgi:ubiquinone/menaquinone biosynthesis C-methylase UbiE